MNAEGICTGCKLCPRSLYAVLFKTRTRKTLRIIAIVPLRKKKIYCYADVFCKQFFYEYSESLHSSISIKNFKNALKKKKNGWLEEL